MNAKFEIDKMVRPASGKNILTNVRVTDRGIMTGTVEGEKYERSFIFAYLTPLNEDAANLLAENQ